MTRPFYNEIQELDVGRIGPRLFEGDDYGKSLFGTNPSKTQI